MLDLVSIWDPWAPKRTDLGLLKKSLFILYFFSSQTQNVHKKDLNNLIQFEAKSDITREHQVMKLNRIFCVVKGFTCCEIHRKLHQALPEQLAVVIMDVIQGHRIWE